MLGMSSYMPMGGGEFKMHAGSELGKVGFSAPGLHFSLSSVSSISEEPFNPWNNQLIGLYNQSGGAYLYLPTNNDFISNRLDLYIDNSLFAGFFYNMEEHGYSQFFVGGPMPIVGGNTYNMHFEVL